MLWLLQLANLRRLLCRRFPASHNTLLVVQFSDHYIFRIFSFFVIENVSFPISCSAYFQNNIKIQSSKIHSSAYRTPELYENKRVLIVGIGNTAVDLAVELVQYYSFCVFVLFLWSFRKLNIFIVCFFLST